MGTNGPPSCGQSPQAPDADDGLLADLAATELTEAAGRWETSAAKTPPTGAGRNGLGETGRSGRGRPVLSTPERHLSADAPKRRVSVPPELRRVLWLLAQILLVLGGVAAAAGLYRWIR